MTTPKRKDVPKKDRWNVEALFPSLQAWEKELKSIVKAKQPPFFPQFAKYKGKLTKSPKIVADMLKELFLVERRLRKVAVWAHLRHDEDIADETFKKADDKIQ